MKHIIRFSELLFHNSSAFFGDYRISKHIVSELNQNYVIEKDAIMQSRLIIPIVSSDKKSLKSDISKISGDSKKAKEEIGENF